MGNIIDKSKPGWYARYYNKVEAGKAPDDEVLSPASFIIDQFIKYKRTPEEIADYMKTPLKKVKAEIKYHKEHGGYENG